MQTRREFLGWGAGLAAGAVGLKAAGFVGHSMASSSNSGSTALLDATTAKSPSASPAETIEVRHFYSRTDLQPPRVRTWTACLNTFGGTSGAYVLPHAPRL